MNRAWPWSRRDDPHPNLPPVEDGRGDAWAAVNAAQRDLLAAKAQTDRFRADAARIRQDLHRIREVRDRLVREGALNHFQDGFDHLMSAKGHR